MTRRLAGLAALLVLAACHPRVPIKTAPEAAGWQPFVADVEVPGSPPAEAQEDEAGVKAWQGPRSEADRRAIAYWDGGAPAWRWDAEARELLASALAPSVEGARDLAALHAAMADAVVAAWRGMARVGRAAPGGMDPSWPSGAMAASTAAAELLGHLFPEAAPGLSAKARAIGETRVAAGAAWPSDVAAGARLGHGVAEAFIRKLDAMGDGRAPMPVQPAGFAEADPELPGAAAWPMWLGSNVPTPAPPDRRALPDELKAVVAANQALDIRGRNLADKWLVDEPVARWSARAAALAERARLDLPHATRLMAWVDLAIADAETTSWRLAYREGWPRPHQLDPALEVIRFAPVHPAWPDDAAAVAGAAGQVLAAAFPEQAAELARDQREVVEAGFDGAQHYRADGRDGLALGRALGDAAVARMRQDAGP